MVAIWVVVLVVSAGLAGALFADSVTTEIKFLSNPESDRAQTVLEEQLGRPTSVTDIVMVRATELTVDDEAFRRTVEDLAGKITALGTDVVAAAPSYYLTEDESQVSPDRRSTIVPIVLAGGRKDMEIFVHKVHEALDEFAAPQGFEVFITGEATLAREFTEQAEKDLLQGETIGIAVGLVILAIVFGAVVAAIIPIILAIIAIVVAFGLVSVIGQFVEMNVLCRTATSRQAPSTHVLSRKP